MDSKVACGKLQYLIDWKVLLLSSQHSYVLRTPHTSGSRDSHLFSRVPSIPLLPKTLSPAFLWSQHSSAARNTNSHVPMHAAQKLLVHVSQKAATWNSSAAKSITPCRMGSCLGTFASTFFRSVTSSERGGRLPHCLLWLHGLSFQCPLVAGHTQILSSTQIRWMKDLGS